MRGVDLGASPVYARSLPTAMEDTVEVCWLTVEHDGDRLLVQAARAP